MTRRLAAGPAGDTIFALASGPGRGAIAVMRLSGADAGTIVGGMAGPLPRPRRASLRTLRDGTGAVLDRALVLWMPGPTSYTGEDIAELHLHGGRAVIRAVDATILGAGGRPADPGEFTRRAFLAGRLNLLEAEAIADLTAAETETQRHQALHQMQGGAGRMVADWATRLTRCVALQEAMIDFPDETANDGASRMLEHDLLMVLAELDGELARARAGERVRDGVVFVIAGRPNVGKSSLFNALIGREAAIVAASPGTTRDTLEAAIDLGGVAVTLVDTAGLRETDDAVEAEGVRRAATRILAADLVLHVSNAAEDDKELPPGERNVVRVASKVDLAPASDGCLGVSTLTGEGLDRLIQLLSEHAQELVRCEGSPILSQARHVAALRDAQRALRAALACDLPELRAEDMQLALASLGRLVGEVDTEAVLDVVFGAFCIGK